MTILGCRCLNILLHIDCTIGKVPEDDTDLSEVQLTLDGINTQQQFLVDTIKEAQWTVVKCKLCNQATHKRSKQQILVYPDLIDYTDNVLEVQNQGNFSTGFNLILPSPTSGRSCAVSDTIAAVDFASLQHGTDSLKREMKLLYDEKLAQFIRAEKQLLDANMKKVDDASDNIRSCLHTYHHEKYRLLESNGTANQDLQPNKHSDSRRVTFSVADEVEEAEEPTYSSQSEEKSPVPQDEFFQFDMGDDDIFPNPAEYESGDEGREEEDDDYEESSSSGFEESDMMEGKSVPINVPMHYARDNHRNRRLSASVKTEDIAHSMKTLMQEFHGAEEDIPRPRVSRSYNPSRFMRS